MTNFSRLYCLLVMTLFLGCGWRDQTLANNGQAGELHLERTSLRWRGDINKTGFCGMDPALPDPTCSCTTGIGLAARVGLVYDWSIIRKIWVRSGNGLGDSTQYPDYIPLAVDTINVSVDPPSAASILDSFECDGGVRIFLDVHLPQDFELSATVGGYTDRWLVRAADTCSAISGCTE